MITRVSETSSTFDDATSSSASMHTKTQETKRRIAGRNTLISSFLLLQLLSFQEGVDAVPRFSALRGGSSRVLTKPNNYDYKFDLPTTTLSEPTLQLGHYKTIESTLPAPETEQDETSSIGSSSASSEVSDLACHFQQALSAINQGKDDIHVGNLLQACERLEGTMRNIGFGQSAKDIAGNVAKIRSVYDKMPANERNSMPALLRRELDTGVISRGQKFKEQSAAMGFLWLGRSINYQYDMFHHVSLNNYKEFVLTFLNLVY